MSKSTFQQNHFDPVFIQLFATPSPDGLGHTSYPRINGTPASYPRVGVASTNVSSSVASSTTIGTDPNFMTCHGCGNTHFLCYEVKYCNYCLHAEIDYFELVGIDFATQHVIESVFSVTYSSVVKKDMMEQNRFYERNRELELPDCIEKVALQDDLYLHSSRRLLQFLLAKRVHDISGHLNNVSNGVAEHRHFPDYEPS